MQLQMYDSEIFKSYKSNAQRVRVLSEGWAEKNLFCASCLNNRLSRLKANTPVSDFMCENCRESFQLKSHNSPLGKRILDGAFATMIQSIKDQTRPNFLLLQYTDEYYIRNLIVIPSFFFVEEIIEKRKPLSESAQRKGWIGCNILMEKIPQEGRIPLIKDGIALEKKDVNARWKKVDFMKKTPLSERGWTIDVLNTIHSLNRKIFSLNEMYAFENEFAKLHPNNRHIRDKIRQQLQILRDKGFLRFNGDGEYSVI